jgi:hypothetical protein
LHSDHLLEFRLLLLPAGDIQSGYCGFQCGASGIRPPVFPGAAAGLYAPVSPAAAAGACCARRNVRSGGGAECSNSGLGSFGTPGSAKCPEMGLGSFGILAQLTREAMIRPSEDILPVSRLQHGKWAPRRKCCVYNETYAVNRLETFRSRALVKLGACDAFRPTSQCRGVGRPALA